MDYKEIKNLISDVGNSKIDELNLEFPDGVKINIKKNNSAASIISNVESKENTIIQKEETITNTQKIEEIKENYKMIKSPMVGTFYSSPSPDAEPFVKVGDKDKKGDVLCIIESMKLMNEIESEYDGEVVEICFKDEDVVEYGACIVKIK